MFIGRERKEGRGKRKKGAWEREKEQHHRQNLTLIIMRLRASLMGKE